MRILILEARYHGSVADALVDGATAALEKGGARFERVSLPGVLELPGAIAIAVQMEEPFHGYVALGAVIGEHTVHDAIYRETMHALATLGLNGFAIGNGIVMAADEAAAFSLAETGDVGGDAARACLALVMFRDRLGYL